MAETTRGSKKSPKTGSHVMLPKREAGTMPSDLMFPRVRGMASGLTPNPAERIVGKAYPSAGRHIGNFSDRKTPNQILRIRTVNEDPAKGA
jgi:hypothetical protein